MGHDIRSGLRSLWKAPTLSAIAILSLALGIGVNAVLFSIVDALVLQPLPFPEPDRVVLLWQNRTQNLEEINDTAPANFIDWREQNRSFQHLAAYQGATFSWADEGVPEEVTGARVTAGFFEALGLTPVLGRSFSTDETLHTAANVAVISHSLWQRRFAADPGVIGRSILLDGVAHTVIGVAPPGWFLIPRAEVWVPLGWGNSLLKRDDHYLSVVGRIRNGVSLEQARRDMAELGARLSETYPRENAGYSVLVRPVGEVFPSERDRDLILILMAIVSFVLLIACVNVASIQLARASAQTVETVTRAVLGASRAVLIRQTLVESLLLALLGGVVAVALTAAAVKVVAVDAAIFGLWRPLQLNTEVLLFTLVTCVVCAAVFGLAPAIQGTATDLNSVLQQGGRLSSRGRAFRSVCRLLVCIEIALATALLIASADMVRGFLKLRETPMGFDPRNLATMTVSLPGAVYGTKQFTPEQSVTLTMDRIAEEVRALPGVTGVAYTSTPPRSESDPRAQFTVPGREMVQAGDAPVASWRAVSANYFSVMRIPVTGRSFTAQDTFGKEPVIIVSSSLAKRLFGGEDPLGKQILFFDEPRLVVGVAQDVLLSRTTATVDAIYLPHAQSPRLRMSFMVRADSAGPALLSILPQAVWKVDRSQPVTQVMSFNDYADLQFASARIASRLLVSFSILALIMVAAGLYGLMNYVVAERSRDFAVQMALGATPQRIFTSVLRETVTLTAVGIVSGIATAFATRPAIERLVGSVVTSMDWMALLATVVILLLVSVVAALTPAVRAVGNSPSDVLRT